MNETKKKKKTSVGVSFGFNLFNHGFQAPVSKGILPSVYIVFNHFNLFFWCVFPQWPWYILIFQWKNGVFPSRFLFCPKVRLFCRISRPTFSGRSSESTTPRTKVNQRGTRSWWVTPWFWASVWLEKCGENRYQVVVDCWSLLFFCWVFGVLLVVEILLTNCWCIFLEDWDRRYWKYDVIFSRSLYRHPQSSALSPSIFAELWFKSCLLRDIYLTDNLLGPLSQTSSIHSVVSVGCRVIFCWLHLFTFNSNLAFLIILMFAQLAYLGPPQTCRWWRLASRRASSHDPPERTCRAWARRAWSRGWRPKLGTRSGLAKKDVNANSKQQSRAGK